MIINELNHLESVSNANAVCGSTGGRVFNQTHNLSTNFYTSNKFETVIKPPADVHNISAAAGAKADAIVGFYPAFTYTKADTLALVDIYGNSTSYSASAALISP
jgi:hypothetical protein